MNGLPRSWQKNQKEKGQKMCWFRGSYQRPLHRIQLRIVVPAFLLSTHRTIGYIEYQNPNCPIFQFSAHQKTFQKAKSSDRTQIDKCLSICLESTSNFPYAHRS